MSDISKKITADLKNAIAEFQPAPGISEIGIVMEAGDGIARVTGLDDIPSQELVEFENGVRGIAFSLEEATTGIIILGEYAGVHQGMQVRATDRIVSVPVGESLLGRVVNALGEPIDGKGAIDSQIFRPIERIGPGVIARQDVDTPVQTGIIAIDSMVPIGRGQRELIIGDRQTGKTALAIDTIINQKNKDLVCIYVAIGQRKASVARTIAQLERHGAMEHTIIVVAAADESATMQYLAPYSGCTIGEEFMENGQDALVIYDDLSKHAWAYRQVSLLLRRSPGREAYPGDIFYLHSRLLERAARLANQYVIVPKTHSVNTASVQDAVNQRVFTGIQSLAEADEALNNMKNKEAFTIKKVAGTGGSLTALPIIETLLGDVSAYVPTNIISITDGQIYLESNLFNAGIRPGINVGISVSRVGGSAQTKAMKQVAGRLRMEMASFRELAAFAQFGSDLDKTTQSQLNRGQHLQEILKQPQYQPISLEDEVLILFAGTNGFSDQIPLEQMHVWKSEILRFMQTTHPEIGKAISEELQITPELDTRLREVLKEYQFTWNA
ncbi:MAG: F0F1 ATP synthase subunit alpha [Anaerolineaceae bacterium]|nr:F0F1 ATP synthase subunit alpha [Anaerolineaceae bacterium]MBN2677216.1 F0F1 ATP synthase subunit alpha [Anaerolineaceae bacterium]